MQWRLFLKSNINPLTTLKSIFIMVSALSADLLTKHYAFKYLQDNVEFNLDAIRQIKVLPIFSLVEVYNKGVSFGMFSDHGFELVLIILISIVIITLSVYAIFAVNNRIRYTIFAIVGGAFGNLYDRVKLGAVRDFIDFHVYDFYWPAFNIADAIICLSVISLIAHDLFLSSPDKQQ